MATSAGGGGLCQRPGVPAARPPLTVPGSGRLGCSPSAETRSGRMGLRQTPPAARALVFQLRSKPGAAAPAGAGPPTRRGRDVAGQSSPALRRAATVSASESPSPPPAPKGYGRSAPHCADRVTHEGCKRKQRLSQRLRLAANDVSPARLPGTGAEASGFRPRAHSGGGTLEVTDARGESRHRPRPTTSPKSASEHHVQRRTFGVHTLLTA